MSKAWTITEARANLDRLIEKAGSHGPQTITKNGRAAAIVFSPQAWRPRRTERIGTLADFFATSPLRNSGLKIPRAKRAL
jgi:prevent-host-death family protein